MQWSSDSVGMSGKTTDTITMKWPEPITPLHQMPPMRYYGKTPFYWWDKCLIGLLSLSQSHLNSDKLLFNNLPSLTGCQSGGLCSSRPPEIKVDINPANTVLSYYWQLTFLVAFLLSAIWKTGEADSLSWQIKLLKISNFQWSVLIVDENQHSDQVQMV